MNGAAIWNMLQPRDQPQQRSKCLLLFVAETELQYPTLSVLSGRHVRPQMNRDAAAVSTLLY